MPTTKTESSESLQMCRVPTFEEKLVRVLAGVVSLTGLGLGFFVSEWWYLLTVFAGLNVIQSALPIREKVRQHFHPIAGDRASSWANSPS